MNTKMVLLPCWSTFVFALTLAQPAVAQGTAAGYKKIGDAESAKGQWKEAVAAYDKAIKLDPNDAMAYGNRGASKRKQEDYKGAYIDLNHAIALNPKLPFTYGNRGLVRYMLDEETGAKADADRAVALAPNDAHAYMFRGMIENTGGDASEALADGNRAVALDSKLPGVFEQRAIANHLSRHWREAADDWKHCVALATEDQQYSRLFLWVAQARLGQKARADSELADSLADGHTQTKAMRWTAKLDDYLLGRSNEESLFKAAISSDATTEACHRCESFYWVGEKNS